MQCSSCGTQLPGGAAFCPTCGAITPSRVSESGISPYDLTSASSPSGAPEHKPATDYGSPPYGAPPQNPYEPLNPYEAPLRPPPPPPPQRHVKIGLIIGAVVLVLIVASASVFALFTQLAKNKPSGETSPSPATTAQTSITATPIAMTATSTANVVTIPYSPYRGTLVLSDPLHDNSKGYEWDEYPLTTYGAACQFKGGSYHVSETDKSHFNACFDQKSNFSNFCFEVQMTIIKGNGGGIDFRADPLQGSSYYFRGLCCKNF